MTPVGTIIFLRGLFIGGLGGASNLLPFLVMPDARAFEKVAGPFLYRVPLDQFVHATRFRSGAQTPPLPAQTSTFGFKGEVQPCN